jgi:hypothetical protein
MTWNRVFAAVSVAALLGVPTLTAQTPTNDPSARLREVLPADVAERVLAKIADARSHGLPAAALEQRALKFAAKGVPPRDIERSVTEHAQRLEQSKDALASARTTKPTDDEIEAGAETMRKGVDGSAVSALAKSAPSGRSLAVPLFVIGGLIDRGLPSDDALERVSERLLARASDAELERMPGELPAQAVAGRTNRPAETGRDLSATKRPANAGSSSGSAGGPPTGVPCRVAVA